MFLPFPKAHSYVPVPSIYYTSPTIITLRCLCPFLYIITPEDYDSH